MMDEIHFKGNVAVDDAVRVDCLLVPRKKIWSVEGIISIAMLFAIGMTLGKALGSSVIALIITCIIGVSVLVMIPRLMERSSIKAKRKFYNENLRDKEGVLTADQVTVIATDSKSEFKWSIFSRFEVMDDLIFVAINNDYLAFAPYMFASSEDWKRCKELVHEKKSNQAARPD